MARLESYDLTDGQVNFKDQTVNRDLALTGSTFPNSYVTLDMKDASDRVSMWLVEYLFGNVALLDALYATRSAYTRLPDGETVCLNKFAPMGSALCFPVESFVFYALLVAALIQFRGFSRREAFKRIWVYGDDIICHFEDHEVLQAVLPKVGLMFNPGKCCTGRSFRESCGCDAYQGIDVTPTKIRTVWSHLIRPQSYLSYCSYQNDFFIKGWFRTAAYIERAVQGVVKTPYKDPCETGYVGLCSLDVKPESRLQGFKTRFSKRYHRYEVKCLAASYKFKELTDLGWSEMLRVSSQQSPFTVAGRYPLTGRINLKPVWCPVTVM
jgi:hypothetical protein